jgi:ribonuclease P protein component
MAAKFCSDAAPRAGSVCPFNMPKLILLKNEKDFAPARFKKSFSSPNLRIRLAFSRQNITRFGFIIPKKVVPLASDRNKIKRRLKAIAQKCAPFLLAADILMFPQKNSLKQPFEKLQAEVINDFKRLYLWKS